MLEPSEARKSPGTQTHEDSGPVNVERNPDGDSSDITETQGHANANTSNPTAQHVISPRHGASSTERKTYRREDNVADRGAQHVGDVYEWHQVRVME
jgi:hypothetical protein